MIRPALDSDWPAIWAILEPTIRAGETYALARDMDEAPARAYWLNPANDAFVLEEDGQVLGTYYLRANQAGGGGHVCNCGFMTGQAAQGKGVARAMGLHALDHARARGFRAMQFNFVVATNTRAVALWESLGFTSVGRLPDAFQHPTLGYVDALVMFQAL
ncbi:GNAT family N-acetyltransferase [Phenylobacterium sp.]|uniref:GNAT family N-acetyltransferase n=1 Tax=Phenylobacterium sp. TaxID=1871053 RepID=UPI00273327F5|nr:GNAT family N-acetyltransferase [Phenylobacterium sp.]MDP3852165.1 GNAT family N-acetyltransferase [Phenylobacterium sp.]